jgi:hypothetical protein
VPEWLEQLPPELEQFEKAEEEDDAEQIVPLSPDVEIERGSMRRKMRVKGERKRCRSVED